MATTAGFQDRRGALLVAAAGLGLAAGGLAWWSGDTGTAARIWFLATLPALVALLVEIAVSLTKGDVGLDIVAALSMSAGLAFAEPLAANVVAMMYAGGQLLEQFAQGRARREMTALMGRVARTAMVYRGGGLEEVAIGAIVQGERVLIRHGEVLPVDGLVEGHALLDLSALTGESLPEALGEGAEALSGAISVGPAFDLMATRPAEQSTYAGIVRLVAAAEASRAPMVRMADRYAIWFLLLTLAIAGAAWYWTRDEIRVLSVLVVATPCPLILAVPVAWIAGMSRAARMGVLVKGGAVLEAMARVRTVVFDKTGTLTKGQAEVASIRAFDGFDESDILHFSASLDQASGHVVAAALIAAARARGLALHMPDHVCEVPGTGIEGLAAGRQVHVGSLAYVRERCRLRDGPDESLQPHHGLRVAVGIDGRLAGLIELEDPLRDDVGGLIEELRKLGVDQVVLASGDRLAVARRTAAQLGLDLVLGDLTPEDKVRTIRQARRPVMMVGDGVNDAPALAAADIGVAMGARGAVSSSEAAGVVLLVDRLEPLVRAMQAARRSRAIALQSLFAGLGLSVAAMVAAGFGLLLPVEGALLQEAIDVAVILNALRALN